MSSTYTIHLTSRAQKDLHKLPPPVKKKIITKLRQLETQRHPPQFKPMSGKTIAQYRLRFGDYRVLYDVYDQDQTVLILRIGHRKDIYR